MKLRNKKTGRIIEVANGTGADWEVVTEKKPAAKKQKKESEEEK